MIFKFTLSSLLQWPFQIYCLPRCIRFGSNPEIAHLVNAVEVTRVETMTIGEIYAYMKQESAKVNLMLQITYSAQHSWYINPKFFFCLISGGAFRLLTTIDESCKVHARRTRVRGSVAYRQGRHMMMIDLDRRMELLSYVTAGFDCINYVTFKFTLIIFKWLFPCIHHPFMLGFRHLNHTDTARLCGLSSIGVGIFIFCDRVLSAGQSPFTTLWYEYDPLH